jgi:hypothetical protein
MKKTAEFSSSTGQVKAHPEQIDLYMALTFICGDLELSMKLTFI